MLELIFNGVIVKKILWIILFLLCQTSIVFSSNSGLIRECDSVSVRVKHVDPPFDNLLIIPYGFNDDKTELWIVPIEDYGIFTDSKITHDIIFIKPSNIKSIYFYAIINGYNDNLNVESYCECDNCYINIDKAEVGLSKILQYLNFNPGILDVILLLNKE